MWFIFVKQYKAYPLWFIFGKNTTLTPCDLFLEKNTRLTPWDLFLEKNTRLIRCDWCGEKQKAYPLWFIFGFLLVENEKMGLVQNVQSAFLLVENQNNSCPLLDRQCMRKKAYLLWFICKINTRFYPMWFIFGKNTTLTPCGLFVKEIQGLPLVIFLWK